MMKFGSVQEILDFAIAREEEAMRFYKSLAEKAEDAPTRQMLLDFAEEETGHRDKLRAVKAGTVRMPSLERVTDLGIGDYLKEPEPQGDVSYQKALIIAMKAEKAAFRLYSDLAEAAPDAQLKDAFLSMAREEARHKLRFELEYDREVLQEM
jgi:rubrerythrin